METALLPSATLAEVYRFAVLLTGNAKTAEQVLAETLARAEPQLAEIRNEASRQAMLAARIREHCLKNNSAAAPPAPRLHRETTETGSRPEVLKIEAFLLAQRIHALPEPERSALALFYLDFLEIEEIARLLKMDLDVFAETLEAARTLLHDSLRVQNGEAAATR